MQVFFADSELFKGNYSREVSVTLRRGELPGIEDISKVKFELVGTSENFIFLYEGALGQTYVIPHSNIVGLAIKP